MYGLVLPIKGGEIAGPLETPCDIKSIGYVGYVASGETRVFRIRVLMMVFVPASERRPDVAEVLVTDGDGRKLRLGDWETEEEIRVLKHYDTSPDGGMFASDILEFGVELRAGSQWGLYRLRLELDGKVAWEWPMMVMDRKNPTGLS